MWSIEIQDSNQNYVPIEPLLAWYRAIFTKERFQNWREVKNVTLKTEILCFLSLLLVLG